MAERSGATLNLRRIRAFIAVGELKSVSEAARRLHMTPPAVSKSVRELERALGVALLTRTPRGMELTPSGEAFFLRGKLALTELELGEDEIAAIRGGAGERVVVGAMPNGSQPIVPLAVARLLQARPGTRISIRGGGYDTMLTAVRGGDMELFVGALPDAAVREGLATEILFHDTLAVIVRPGHPLAAEKTLSVADLAAAKWILPDVGSGLRERIERSFRAAKLRRPMDWVEVAPLGAMRTILRESDHVAATTRMRVKDELDLGLLVALDVSLPGAREPIGLVRRPIESLSRSGRALLDEVRAVARDIAPAAPGAGGDGATL